jgi:hypothetical protein
VPEGISLEVVINGGGVINDPNILTATSPVGGVGGMKFGGVMIGLCVNRTTQQLWSKRR